MRSVAGSLVVSAFDSGSEPDGAKLESVPDATGRGDGVNPCEGELIAPEDMTAIRAKAQAAPPPASKIFGLLRMPFLRLRLLPLAFKSILNFSLPVYKVRQVCQMTCMPQSAIPRYDHTMLLTLNGSVGEVIMPPESVLFVKLTDTKRLKKLSLLTDQSLG